MISQRHSDNWAPVALFLAVLAAILLGFAAIAHGAAVVTMAGTTEPVLVVAGGIDWATTLTAVAAWGGFALGVALTVLRFVAPRTKATWDDDLLARLESIPALAAGLNEILFHVRKQAVTTGTTTTNITVEQPTTPAVALVPPVAGLLLVLLLGSLCVAPACTGAQRTAVGHAAWDCLAPQRAEAVAAVTPLVTSLILAAASADGRLIDTAPIRAATSKASLLTDAGILLSCATASAFAALLHPPAPTPGAPAAAGLELDPRALRAAYESLRPTGATFVTRDGEI